MEQVTGTSPVQGPRAAVRVSPQLVFRRGLLLVAATAALTGVFAGLGRVGVVVAWGPGYVSHHGPLLVLGTFVTVIGLERAVALGHGFGFIAPSLGALTAVALLAGFPWAGCAATASALALVGLNLAIVRRQALAFTWLMLLGSAVLVLGSVLWALGRPVFQVVPTWIGFFVLTIVAERLELSRLVPTPRSATVVLVVFGSLLAVFSCTYSLGVGAGLRPFGLTLALTAAWQLRFDLARRTVRRPGTPDLLRWGCSWVPRGSWLRVCSSRRWACPPRGRSMTPRCTACSWDTSSRWSSPTRPSFCPRSRGSVCHSAQCSTCRLPCCTSGFWRGWREISPKTSSYDEPAASPTRSP